MRKKPLKLKTILILFTGVLIVATLGVSGVISFRMFEKSMVGKIGNSRVDVLSQISEKASAIKLNADLLSNLYFYNENITKLYHPEGYTEEEKQKIEDNFKQIEDNFKQIEELSAMTSAVTEMDFY